MINLDQLYKDGEEAYKLQEIFLKVENDVLAGKNLLQHIKDITASIYEMDIIIENTKSKGGKTESLEEIQAYLQQLRIVASNQV